MKKMILVITAVLISLVSFSQMDSTNHMMDNNKMGNGMNHQAMNKSYGDGVMMLNGKMMMEHSGKMTMMNNDTTMSNGTKVMTNGTCITKNGTKIMMKEGQHMDMSGKMMLMKDSKMKN